MNTELPLDLLGEPLRGQIDWLRRRHRLTAAAATMAAMVSILGVVGPSRRILDPQDLTCLPPALSLVMYGDPVSPIRAVLNLGLDPIRQWLLSRVDKLDRRRVRLRIADLNDQLLRQEFRLRNAVLPETPGLQGSRITEKELQAIRAEIATEIADITDKISDQGFRLRPFLIADNAPIRRLLDPGELSHDGAVLAASLTGHAVTAWTKASRAEKAELSRLLTNTWHGLPDAADETRHIQPQLSNVIVTDSSGVKTLREDRDLVGVCSHLLFIPALQLDGATDLHAACPDEITDQWVHGLQALVSARIRAEITDYRLSAPAVARFQQYLDEAAGCRDSSSERRATLCLKLALLAHCGSRRDEAEITADTMEVAAALTGAISSPPPPPRSPSPEDEIESLLAKLHLRGPLRWRELLRGRHLHKADPLVSLLDSAIASGRVRREGDLYYAVDAVSASANP